VIEAQALNRRAAPPASARGGDGAREEFSLAADVVYSLQRFLNFSSANIGYWERLRLDSRI
jgi:hypothetical protein